MTEAADPILYSFRRCPFAMRARLPLALSGTRYEMREISLRAKPTAMLAASAKGTVPVLSVRRRSHRREPRHHALGTTTCDPEGWLERDDPELIVRKRRSLQE